MATQVSPNKAEPQRRTHSHQVMLSSTWSWACTGIARLAFMALLLHQFTIFPVSGSPSRDETSKRNCTIRKTGEGKSAHCSGKHLTQVPQNLPKDLVSLDLSINDLFELTNDSLSRYTNLRHLDLGFNNQLIKISAGAFEKLPLLTDLSFRCMKSISFQTMFRCLHGLKGRSLSVIDFEHAHYLIRGLGSPVQQIIDNSLTSILAEVCVSHLSLRHNEIIYIDMFPLIFGPFRKCIQSIDLSNNHLEGGLEVFVLLPMFVNLETFSVAVDGADSFHTRQDVLDPNPFDNNVIHISNSSVEIPVVLPRNLSHLDFSGIVATTYVQDVTFFAPGLQKLSASRTGLRNFTHRIYGLEHLEDADISHCDLSIISPEFFDTFPNLTRLNMSRVFLKQQFLLHWGQRLFQPLTQLHEIDLSDNDLSQLPDAPFPTARRVYLSDNHFSAIPIDVSKSLHLEELDLRFNAISVLHESQMATLDDVVSQGRNLSLRLYGNPLACDCSVLTFLTWLQTTAVRLDQDGDLPCLTGAKTYSNVSQVVAEANMWRRCAATFWLVFSAVGLTLLVLVAVLVWMGSKFSSQLQHLVLRWLNVGGRGRVRGDFHYDVYVGYNAEDVPLVYRMLRGQLEGKGGVRLFLRERELHDCVAVGGNFAEGIFEGMSCCWRTLFVVTPNLLQDDWFNFMVAVAYQTLDWRTPGRIVLLLAGPVSMADIPQTLLSVVEEEDIFLLPDQSEDHPVWDRLLGRILGGNVPPLA